MNRLIFKKGLLVKLMKSLSIVIVICFIFINILNTTSSAQMESQRKVNLPEPQTTEAMDKYRIVDTGQEEFFNNYRAISMPSKGQPFYGQDAQQHRAHPTPSPQDLLWC